MIQIAVYYDGKTVKEVNFEQATAREITIGRAPGCLLRLDEATVSRLHALIRWNGSAWVLERKASFGAVRVNGEEVENAILQGGEEIAIGKFSLRVQVDSGMEEAAPTADSGVFHDHEGRTRALNLAAVGVFRIDPGMANTEQFVMSNDKAVFGRASNCDVVLLEKKASRKHFEVRREGLTYYLKDLKSANSTLVNTRKVDEVELNPGDEIRVGETLIKFSVENPEFFQNQQDFMQVPAALEEAAPAPTGQYAVAMHEPQAIQPYAGDTANEFVQQMGEPESKSLFVKLYRKYKQLPVGRRYLVLLLVLAGILILFDDEQKPQEKKVAVKKHSLVKDPTTGKILRVYENLSKERQKLVDKNYAELKDAFDKKDFERVLERTTTILNFVDDYKETKFYESRARAVMEQREKEAHEREQHERQQRIREEVVALEQKGAAIYKKALADPKLRPQVTDVAQEIFSKDPNDRLAQEWLDGMKQKEAEEAQEKEETAKKAALKKKGDAAFALVERKFEQGKYLEALDEADKLESREWSTNDYIKRVDAFKGKVHAKLASLIDPIMAEAEELRSKNADLVKAKDLYLKVLRINPRDEGAIRGLDSIRGTLHLRAKQLYDQAILAESVSDLNEAKEKFDLCKKTAPEGDIYKKRCENKLVHYEGFSAEGFR